MYSAQALKDGALKDGWEKALQVRTDIVKSSGCDFVQRMEGKALLFLMK